MTAGGAALRAWRERENVSQKAFGLLLGVPQSDISQYETGKRQPSITMGLAIQEKTGVPLEDWAE